MNLFEIISTQQDPLLGKSLQAFIDANVSDFKRIVARAGNTLGGVSVSEAFWLYHLIKAVQPKQIIESGTFYGYSMHYIHDAASCDILSYDIDQSKCPKLDKVQYFEHDWTEGKFSEGEGTFVFFDDHIDQDKRLREAVERNQEHIVFHDNYLTLKHSHKPIRFCDKLDATLCYTLPPIYSDPIFTDTSNNAQTYRWLTYIHRENV